MLALPLALLLLSLQAGVDDRTARRSFEAALVSDAEFRRKQFVEAGLPPIEALAAERRQVRRLMVRVWLPGAPPAIEIERRRNGSVTLLLTRKGHPDQRHTLPRSAWSEITRFDRAVFERPRYAPRSPGPPPYASCHGTSAYFEAADRGRVRTAGANQCADALVRFNAGQRAALAAFVRHALATQPACKPPAPREQPEDALARCFR